jgi:hypothetical protein
MVPKPHRKSRIPLKIIIPLVLVFMGVCVLAAGCIIPINKNTTIGNSSSPTITPSITATTPAAIQTPVPNRTQNSTGTKKGLLNISVGDYPAEPPATVFLDNVSVGNVSGSKPLNLTAAAGRHTVRVCVTGTCIQEEVLIMSSNPTTLDFGERLKKEAVSGSLSISIGGYNAELPVFIDNASVGNVSMTKPLNLRVSEGIHTVKVCVGIICENETVAIKFAQPVYIDFGERLKRDAEFSTPTIRIVDTRQTEAKVTVDVEFINPGKNDLTMSATIRLAYSYIDPQTHWRNGDTKEGTITKSVKAGTRTVHSLVLSLTGGKAYIIEVPVILDEPSS